MIPEFSEIVVGDVQIVNIPVHNNKINHRSTLYTYIELLLDMRKKSTFLAHQQLHLLFYIIC